MGDLGSDREWERGQIVGRYVLLSQLGAGSTGVVYAAFDPELDRKVTLKRLRADVLLSDAQALAQLSHPNVVAVHDVGTQDGVVWVATEFVPGRTIAAWLREPRSTWREVLAVLRPVAQGLLAAHEAGLVHGDIKPENIILGDDGRARLTHFGSAAGTKGYRGPEQPEGASADARADQYAYCVVVWEALFGTRPVEGSTRTPATNSAVPRWLRRAIERGLAPDPDRRWRSLAALLDAMDRGRTRARVSKLAAAAGVIAAVGAIAWGWHRFDGQQRLAGCERAGAVIDEVWSDESRASVRAGLLATGAGHAGTTADKLMPWLNQHADAWRTARTQACLDHEVRGIWDVDLLDRSTFCLQHRRLEFAALVTALQTADDQTLRYAVQNAARLRDVDPCRDPIVLERLPPPPEEGRAEVQAVQAQIARVGVLHASGAFDDGLRVAQDALARAEALAWPPLRAAARARVGKLLATAGSYPDAELAFETAYFEAGSAGAGEAALEAAHGLIFLLGDRLSRYDDAALWARHADLVRATLPDPGRFREATALSFLARVRIGQGSYDEATELNARTLAIREAQLNTGHPDLAESLADLGESHRVAGRFKEAAVLLERAVKSQEAALGPDHPLLVAKIRNLGSTRAAMGAYTEAKGLFRRAFAIREKAYGRDHPEVAKTLTNLATVHTMSGEYDEAAALFGRALSMFESNLGPDHLLVAATLANLANVRVATGQLEDAANLTQRALTIRESQLGWNHGDVASCVNNLATIKFETGAYDEAAPLFERALRIRERALSPDHPELAAALSNLADARRAMGAYDDARAGYRRALSIWENALGLDHAHLAYPLLGLARIALAEHRSADAVLLAERAAKVRDAGEVQPGELAEARFVLARALVQGGRSTARARTLAEQARDGYRGAGDAGRDALAETEAWLRKHSAR